MASLSLQALRHTYVLLFFLRGIIYLGFWLFTAVYIDCLYLGWSILINYFPLLCSLCKYLTVASGRASVFIVRARAERIMKVFTCVFVFHLVHYYGEDRRISCDISNLYLLLDTLITRKCRLGTMLLAWFVCMKLVERLRHSPSKFCTTNRCNISATFLVTGPTIPTLLSDWFMKSDLFWPGHWLEGEKNRSSCWWNGTKNHISFRWCTGDKWNLAWPDLGFNFS